MEQNSTNSANNNPFNSPVGSSSNQTPSGSGSSMNNYSHTNGHKKVGPIVATLVIVLILIIAALYVFASRINQQTVPSDTGVSADVMMNGDTQSATAQSSVQPVTGTADDPASLQKDLNTSTRGVDAQTF